MPKWMVAGRLGLWLLFGLAVSGLGVWNGELVLVDIGGFLTGVSLLALVVTPRRRSRRQAWPGPWGRVERPGR